MLSNIIAAASIAHLLFRASIWPLCNLRLISQKRESSSTTIFSTNFSMQFKILITLYDLTRDLSRLVPFSKKTPRAYFQFAR